MKVLKECAFAATLLATIVSSSAIPQYGPQIAARQAPGTPTIEVQQLIAGLGFNIMAQKGEVAVASMLQSLVQMPTSDPALFKVAKVHILLTEFKR